MRLRRWWPLVFVSVLACDSSPTSPSDPGSSAPSGIRTNSGFEQQVVDLMNQRRSQGATCGGQQFGSAGALRMNAQLRAAARDHSIDMVQRNYVDHVSPEGRTFSQRARDAGYRGQPVAENIAWGQGSPSAVMSSWMSSPGHCRNIMRGDARDVGVGFASSRWTAKFGR